MARNAKPRREINTRVAAVRQMVHVGASTIGARVTNADEYHL
jgi:hypothetical protein